jgi:hypothetical protein
VVMLVSRALGFRFSVGTGTSYNSSYVHRRLEGASGSAALRRAAPPQRPLASVRLGAASHTCDTLWDIAPLSYRLYYSRNIVLYIRRIRTDMASTINASWHKTNQMPKNATLDQRVDWHLAHLKACGCRKDLPSTILKELNRRGITPPNLKRS